MTQTELGSSQERMNTEYRHILDRLLTNAERDVRLARSGGDRAATAKAQARLETLKAALAIYAAAHLRAHGERPWPRKTQP